MSLLILVYQNVIRMVSPVMSFEDFMKKIRTDVNTDIKRANLSVEEQLPDILDIKRRNMQRSLLIDPDDVQSHLRDMIAERHSAEHFLDVVSAVRGQDVDIDSIIAGHRQDKRDFLIKGKDPKTGQNTDDYRVLVGDKGLKGKDIRNEVTQTAFYKALNLRAYRQKASFEREDESGAIDLSRERQEPAQLDAYKKTMSRMRV